MEKYKAYQIAFDEKSLANIDQTFATPIYEPKVSPFFENAVINRIVGHSINQDSEYLAVVSHKFFVDTVDRELKPITKEKIESSLDGTDVISFFGYKRDNMKMFQFAEKVHKGIGVCYEELFKLLGLKYDSNLDFRFIVYRNAFFAKTEVYERYVNEILSPCIELMSDKSNVKLYTSIWKDSKYPYQESRFRHHPELKAKFIKDIGVAYYPFHTFILERMFPFWLTINKEITCKHI